jgi:hypothetical protein
LKCPAVKREKDIKWQPISGKNAYGRIDIRRNKSEWCIFQASLIHPVCGAILFSPRISPATIP